MRGVPRERPAISVAPPSSMSTFRMREERWILFDVGADHERKCSLRERDGDAALLGSGHRFTSQPRFAHACRTGDHHTRVRPVRAQRTGDALEFLGATRQRPGLHAANAKSFLLYGRQSIFLTARGPLVSACAIRRRAFPWPSATGIQSFRPDVEVTTDDVIRDAGAF